MQCSHFDRFECRSCSLLDTPYEQQLNRKFAAVKAVLGLPDSVWREPFASPEQAFRNKAKFVVGGRPGELSLGIYDARRGYVDLRDCPIIDERLREAAAVLGALLDDLRVAPYDIASRSGELKYLLLTISPDGELLTRFVLRSSHHLDQLRSATVEFASKVPGWRVGSVNLQPEHKAIIEGPDEVLLTEAESLPMRLAVGEGGLTLHLRPQSFFQTNTAVATALYQQALDWVWPLRPSSGWDLYCGVGGFALTLLPAVRSMTGVEVSTEAIASAQLSDRELREHRSGLGRGRFVARDARGYALASPAPQLVVVNPPRRGIGRELAEYLNRSATRFVLYSSCNATTLAADLSAMPWLTVRQARLFDMFPHTEHHEVLVLAERTTKASPGRRRRRHP